MYQLVCPDSINFWPSPTRGASTPTIDAFPLYSVVVWTAILLITSSIECVYDFAQNLKQPIVDQPFFFNLIFLSHNLDTFHYL